MKIIKCKHCGKDLEKHHNKVTYHKDCAKEVNILNKRKAAKKYYQRNKDRLKEYHRFYRYNKEGYFYDLPKKDQLKLMDEEAKKILKEVGGYYESSH